MSHLFGGQMWNIYNTKQILKTCLPRGYRCIKYLSTPCIGDIFSLVSLNLLVKMCGKIDIAKTNQKKLHSRMTSDSCKIARGFNGTDSVGCHAKAKVLQ